MLGINAKLSGMKALAIGASFLGQMMPRSLHPTFGRAQAAPNHWGGLGRKSVANGPRVTSAPNKYRPHQGAKECARRREHMGIRW